MSTINDGGPAFPKVESRNYTGEAYIQDSTPRIVTSGGMTLRDYFAAAALQGYMQSCSLHDQPMLWAPKMAEYAYIQADAMLAARERKGDAT